MLAQFAFDIKTILKDKLYYAVIIVLAVLFIMPLFSTNFYFSSFSVEDYRYQSQFAQQEANSSSFESMPQDLKDIVTAEVAAYQSIILGHTKIDSREQFEGMLRIEELKLQRSVLGYPSFVEPTQTIPLSYLSGGSLPEPDAIVSETKIALFSEHLKKDIYVLYADLADMPSLNYLVNQLVALQQNYLFLPVIIIASVLVVSINRTRSQLFALSVPLSTTKTNVVHAVAGTGMALIALILATIPSIIFCATKNGLGRFDYPVVSLLPDGVWAGDISIFLARFFVLLLLGCLLLATLMLLVSQLADNRVAVTVSAIAVVLLPSYSSYFGSVESVSTLTKWLPTTYFEIPKVIGNTYVPMYANPLENSGINFTFGVFIQLGATILLFALAVATPIILREIQRLRVSRFSPHAHRVLKTKQ